MNGYRIADPDFEGRSMRAAAAILSESTSGFTPAERDLILTMMRRAWLDGFRSGHSEMAAYAQARMTEASA